MNDAPNQADTPQPVYTPPAIKGYRKLTQAELDSVNAVKNLGEQIDAALGGIACVMLDQQDGRALALAKTNLQQGLMWLTRSITKPETFA